jgi:hypothetical protein
MCGVSRLRDSTRRPKLKLPTAGIKHGKSLMPRKTTQPQPSNRASYDAALHRRMRQQSLKTSWRSLADASDQLIEWRSFTLWVRAIIEAERSVPHWLNQAIDQRCPGFLKGRPSVADPDSLWLDLTTWLDEHVFTAAQAGGWIEALNYYAGRDSRSERIWNYWDRVEREWRELKPQRYPTADEWHREAADYNPTRSENATLVAQYIEWEAFSFWVRLIVERDSEINGELGTIIEQRCPGFLKQIRDEKQGGGEYSIWLWRRLLAWIEAHILADATNASLDAVRDSARTDFRGERIAEYWAHCSSRWRKHPPDPYPDFEQWLQDADAFVVP